jgi:aspartyl-tRNA synthetase
VQRTKIIAEMRRLMGEAGFTEFSTPILTASSPEGARDFLVPSRLHEGKFYALPQAPQIYKQLIMVSGFDRYFQIAPCFRDEDPRADRLPGEFYQLDLEMSFVEQDDVLATMEPVIRSVFEAFAEGKKVTPEFRRIAYDEAILYGTDKPDLRNPIEMQDVSEHFRGSGFKVFANILANDPAGGGLGHSGQDRRLERLLRPHEFMGAGRRPAGARLHLLARGRRQGRGRGADRQEYRRGTHRGDPPAARPQAGRCLLLRRRQPEEIRRLRRRGAHARGRGTEPRRPRPLRALLDRRLPLLRVGRGREEDRVRATTPSPCRAAGWARWRTRTRSPSRPIQYDLVCNGFEIASGGIRNHLPETMVKAFEIVGFDAATVEERFGGLYRAFQYGAPPHGGMAAGIDRIVMLLVGAKNLREVTMFPMNQQAQDLLMSAPAEASPQQLRELHLRVAPSAKKD